MNQSDHRLNRSRLVRVLLTATLVVFVTGCPGRYSEAPEDAVPGTEQSYISDKPEAVPFRNPSPYPQLTMAEFENLPLEDDFTVRNPDLARRTLADELDLEGFGWQGMEQIGARILVPSGWSTVGLPALESPEKLYRLRSHPEGELGFGVKLEIYRAEGSPSAFFRQVRETYADDPNARTVADQIRPAYLGDMKWRILETTALKNEQRAMVREYVLGDERFIYHMTASTMHLDNRTLWRRLFDFIAHSLMRGYRAPDLPYAVNWERQPRSENEVFVWRTQDRMLSFGEKQVPTMLAAHRSHQWLVVAPDYQAGPDGSEVTEITFPEEESDYFQIEFNWPVNLEPELYYPRLRIWSRQAKSEETSESVMQQWVERFRQSPDFLEAEGDGAEWTQFPSEQLRLSEEVRMLQRTVRTRDPERPEDPTIHRLYAVVRGPRVYRMELLDKPQGHPRLKKMLRDVVRSFAFFGNAAKYDDDASESNPGNSLENFGIEMGE